MRTWDVPKYTQLWKIKILWESIFCFNNFLLLNIFCFQCGKYWRKRVKAYPINGTQHEMKPPLLKGDLFIGTLWSHLIIIRPSELVRRFLTELSPATFAAQHPNSPGLQAQGSCARNSCSTCVLRHPSSLLSDRGLEVLEQASGVSSSEEVHHTVFKGQVFWLFVLTGAGNIPLKN